MLLICQHQPDAEVFDPMLWVGPSRTMLSIYLVLSAMLWPEARRGSVLIAAEIRNTLRG